MKVIKINQILKVSNDTLNKLLPRQYCELAGKDFEFSKKINLNTPHAHKPKALKYAAKGCMQARLIL